MSILLLSSTNKLSDVFKYRKQKSKFCFHQESDEVSGFPGSAIEVIPRLFTTGYPTRKTKERRLYKVFAENFPIADTRNNFVLEFLDYYIDPPHYTIDDCLERGLTYSVPLKAKLKLIVQIPIMRILILLFKMFIWVLFLI